MWLVAVLLGASLTAPEALPKILYVGDSVAVQNAGALAKALAPAEFHDLTLGGTAICDYLEGTPTWLPPSAKLDSAVRRIQPDLVILQFWGNDFWSPCAQGRRGETAFYDQYFWNALSARREIDAAGGAKMLWVLQAPMPQRDVPRRLNEIYQYVADLSGDRVTDAGATVSPAHDRYEFTRFLPCTAPEQCTDSSTTRVHSDNDDIHFCLDGRDPGRDCEGVAPGINRYVERISRDAKASL